MSILLDNGGMTKKKHPKVIAHRGNSSQAPENTEIAFKQAIRLPVDYLECDVQISKDGVPVVIHDGTFHRITSDLHPHPINELNIQEIKTIDAGSWFDLRFSDQKVMTMEEFLYLPRGRTGVMLEVKEETFSACALGKNIADVLKAVEPRAKKYGPVVVGSLSPNVILCLEAYLPEQPLIPIVKDLSDVSIFRSVHPSVWAFKYSLVSKEMIEAFHDEGSEVWVWTVDDKTVAKELLDMGVDGIITNQPKKMLSLCRPASVKTETVAAKRFNNHHSSEDLW